MATTPPGPEQPAQPEAPGPGPGYSTTGPGFGSMSMARLPYPGNAEFAVYVFILCFLILIWILADSVNTAAFSTLMTALTFGYLISRGIAKASRVLEH